jgi:mycothiol synthase
MTDHAGMPVTIAAAHSQELVPALRLVFGHLSPALQQSRVANALELIERHEIAAEAIRVARRGTALLGAMIGVPLAGAAALVWPPRTCEPRHPRAVEDQLLRETMTWLLANGTRLIQALLSSSELDRADCLIRNGFEHITRLWYLRSDLRGKAGFAGSQHRLTYRTYEPETMDVFHQTLLRTYIGTLDCPELNDVRSIEQIIAGHRSQGVFDPARWWLAMVADQPVGVLLLTEMSDLNSWDLSYLGIVPEARRRGFGRCLARKAVLEARQAGAAELTLSVDGRNQPARTLYEGLGFEPFDQREVYLAFANNE